MLRRRDFVDNRVVLVVVPQERCLWERFLKGNWSELSFMCKKYLEKLDQTSRLDQTHIKSMDNVQIVTSPHLLLFLNIKQTYFGRTFI